MPLWRRSADLAIMTTIGQAASTEGLAELLLNSTGEGIYGVDLEGNCTFANPACLRLLGFDSDSELLGRNMHNLVHHSLPNGAPVCNGGLSDLSGVPCWGGCSCR